MCSYQIESCIYVISYETNSNHCIIQPNICVHRVNYFQAVLISNGTTSYAIFIYNCGSVKGVGYNGYRTIDSDFLETVDIESEVTCYGGNTWNNLVYVISQRGELTKKDAATVHMWSWFNHYPPHRWAAKDTGRRYAMTPVCKIVDTIIIYNYYHNIICTYILTVPLHEY